MGPAAVSAGAALRRACRADLSAVGADNGRGYGKADSRPAGAAAPGFIGAVKPFKDMGKIGFRYADAGIGDGNFPMGGGGRCGGRAPRRGGSGRLAARGAGFFRSFAGSYRRL
jgi:hypothetical protein